MGPCPLVAGVSHVSVSLNVSLSVWLPAPMPGTQPAQGGCSGSADRERENLTLTPVWVPVCRRRLGWSL